jgi:hypothetical protein
MLLLMKYYNRPNYINSQDHNYNESTYIKIIDNNLEGYSSSNQKYF